MSDRTDDGKLFCQQMPVLCCVIDQSGCIRNINEAGQQELKRAPRELINRPLIDFAHPDDQEAAGTALRSCAAGETPSVTFELRYRHGDGHWIWLRWHAWSLEDEDSLCAIASNITNVSEQSVTLERTQYLLERTSRIASVGTWEIDLRAADEPKLVWTSEVYRIHELQTHDQQTLESALAFHPQGQARDAMTQCVHHAMATGAGWDVELPLITAKGRRIWVRSQGSADRNANNDVIRLVGALQDVTSRKLAQENLERNTQCLRELHEINSDQNLSSSEKIHKVLQLGCDIFDLPCGIVSHIEKNSYTVAAVVAPDQTIQAGTQFELAETYCAEVLRSQKAEHYHNVSNSEMRRHTCYQTFGLESYLGAPVSLNNSVYGTINFSSTTAREAFTAHDIDLLSMLAQWVGNELHREQQHKDLIASRKEAEKANQAKSFFLENMSHEIRTPMNGVLGMAQLLEQTITTDNQKEQIRIITESATSLLGVVNEILDFSKVESGHHSISLHRCVLTHVVAQAVDVIAPVASEKNIQLSHHFDSDIPPAILSDSARLRQILINLLGNAVKFTDHGRVQLNVKHDEQDIMFTVTDTGSGFDADIAAHMFSPFIESEHSPTRAYGGTGLGLSICKLLVELMGGHIGCTSRINHGSSFWFTIPNTKIPTNQKRHRYLNIL